MQIVINIPEEFGVDIEDKFQDFFKRLEVETKEHMINGVNLVCGAYELETIEMFMQVLAKGVLLPKRHGRLIDADEFHHTLEDMPIRDTDKWFNWLQKACNRLAEAPTIVEADKEE